MRCSPAVAIVYRQLIDAFIPLPVAVEGGGRSTITQQIQQIHQVNMECPPWLRSWNQYFCDQFIDMVLAESGYSYTIDPCDGDGVNLRLIETTEWGGLDEDLPAAVHPDNLALAIGVRCIQVTDCRCRSHVHGSDSFLAWERSHDQ